MSSDLKLMFLAAQRFENDEAFRGAFLITDDNTTPLEFRCTSPVRPTALQKTLYGGILDQYILVNLIGLPLVRSATIKPDLILVRDASFLELRPQLDIPILRIYKDIEVDPGIEDKSQATLITSESGKFEPVLIGISQRFYRRAGNTQSFFK